MVIYFLGHGGVLSNILLVSTFHHQILEWSDELSACELLEHGLHYRFLNSNCINTDKPKSTRKTRVDMKKKLCM